MSERALLGLAQLQRLLSSVHGVSAEPVVEFLVDRPPAAAHEEYGDTRASQRRFHQTRIASGITKQNRNLIEPDP